MYHICHDIRKVFVLLLALIMMFSTMPVMAYANSGGVTNIEEDQLLEEDYTIEEGATLMIAAEKTLTIPEGKTLTNNGTLIVSGTLIVNGTLESNGTIQKEGTISGEGTLIKTETHEDFIRTTKTVYTYELSDLSLQYPLSKTEYEYSDSYGRYLLQRDTEMKYTTIGGYTRMYLATEKQYSGEQPYIMTTYEMEYNPDGTAGEKIVTTTDFCGDEIESVVVHKYHSFDVEDPVEDDEQYAYEFIETNYLTNKKTVATTDIDLDKQETTKSEMVKTMLTDSGQAYRITTTLDSAKDGRSITVEDVKAKTKVVSTGAIGKRDFYSTFTTAVSLYNMEDPENPVKIPITSGTLTSSYESLTITITYLDGSQVITQDLEDDEFMVTKKNAAGETVSKITYHANGTYTIEGFELSLAAKSSSVYSGSGILSFDSNDDPINLQSLSIGESVLSTEDYSVESSNDTDGGMTITIDASVLSSLSNGSYTLTLTTVNGSADCDFTVSKISYHYTKPTTETPKDADGDTDTPTVDWEKKIKDGVENTTISAKSKVTSGSITVFWTKSKGYKVDGYQIFRSTKKSGGYKKFFTTTKNSYKNTKTLTSGKRYYYKVRGYRSVNGKKVYTQWSNIVSRKAI